MNIQDDQHIDPSSDLALPEYALNLLDAKKSMIRARELAESWSESTGDKFAGARAIFTRADIDEETKILMVAQLARTDLPDQLVALIRARSDLRGAQAMSQAIVGGQ